MPHDCVDPIPVACEIVTALQTFIARQVPVADPAVLTIAKIEAGTTHNIIPGEAKLLGTLRTLSEETRANQIGRAACRERGWHDGCISVVAVYLKKKTNTNNDQTTSIK